MKLQLELVPPGSINLIYTRQLLLTLPLHDPNYHAILRGNILPTTEQQEWATRQRVEAAERLTTLQEELRFTLEPAVGAGAMPEIPPVEVNISKNGISYTYSQYLQSEISDTRVYLERLTTVSSSFRRLDPDILRQIFELAFDMLSPCGKRVDPLDEDSLQWRLARVCRAWWNVAFSIPRFFSILKFDFTSTESGLRKLVQGDRKVELIARILQQTSPNPLSLTLLFPDRDAKNKADSDDGGVRRLQDHPIVHLLVPESHRWQHLTLNGRAYTDLMCMPELQDRLPSLESIQIDGSFREERAAHCTVLLHSAPRLSSVDARYVDLSLLHIPFPQLSFVRGHVTADLSDCALSRASNLTRATISIWARGSNTGHSSQAAGTCTIPLLQDLTLRTCEVPVQLITPRLQILRIHYEDLVQSIPLSVEVLSRLQELHLSSERYSEPLPPTSVIARLQLMPQLTVLSLSRLPLKVSEHLYIALTPRPNQPVLCPSLEVIEEAWVDIISQEMVTCVEHRAKVSSTMSGCFSALKVFKLRGVYPRSDLNTLFQLPSLRVDY